MDETELAAQGQQPWADEAPGRDPKARDRRVVTVFFADVVGSTALIQGADAEAAMDILAPAIALMGDAVRRYGGTVAQRSGDGIMAIFGIPFIQEDHAERACHAALALQQAVQAHDARPRWTRENKLQVRVGLSSGRVLAADTEDAAGRVIAHGVSGSVVHLARRMEAAAAPGSVVVSESTHQLVGHKFECSSLGIAALKGFTQPQSLYEVLRPRRKANFAAFDASGRPSGEGGSGRRPLVGRQSEIDAISGLFARLADTGTGGLLLIAGEAGIGKTRLLEEIRPLHPHPVSYLEGHARSFGQRLSYWPFIEMLRPFLGLLEGAGDDDAWAALARTIGRLFPSERDEVLPYAATLLGIKVPDPSSERVRYLDSETLARHVLRAGYRLFERLAQDAPVVLVIDDVHWLDGSSAALVEHLLPIAASGRLLIVALGRSQEMRVRRLHELGAAALPHDAFLEVALQPLTVSESQRLIRLLLEGDADGIDRTRDMVLYKAGGNPFYLQEVIRALVDAKAIVRDQRGRWSAPAHQDMTIPDTVQGVVMARIDRLDERLKGILGVAAVIGRSFFHRVLRAVVDHSDGLDEGLSGLKAANLIADHTAASELAYIFQHALVQESVYESLLLARRRTLHGQVAACIELLFSGNGSQEFASVLALHYARAEMWDKALHFLLQAAEQATRMAGDDEALLHYVEALDALGRTQKVMWGRAQHAAVERRLAEIYLRRGEPKRAREHIDTALARFGDRLPSSPSGVRRAIAAEIVRHLALRATHRFGVVRQHPSDPDTEAQADLHELLAWIFYFSDHTSMLLIVLRWLNRSIPAGVDEYAAKGIAALGFLLDTAGAHRTALGYHRRAVAAAEQLEHLPTIGLAYNLLGTHFTHTGDWRDAERCLDRSREAAERAGDLYTWSSASILRCRILCEFGRFDEVLAEADKMGALGREAAFGPAVRWAGAARGNVLRRLGRLPEAEEAFQKTIQLSIDASDHVNLAGTRGEFGHCLHDMGRDDEAMAVLQVGHEGAVAHKVRGHALVWLATGRARGAVIMAQRTPGSKASWSDAKKHCNHALFVGRRFRMGLVPALRIRGSLEWCQGRRSTALRWWNQSIVEAETVGARFEQALGHLEAGVKLDDAAQIGKARDLFAAMGSDQAARAFQMKQPAGPC